MTWTLRLYKESLQSTSANNKDRYEFTVTFSDLCTLDEISPFGSIDDVTFIIGSAPQNVVPVFQQSDTACPVERGVRYIDGGENPLTTPQLTVLTFNDVNSLLTIDTSDGSFAGTTWTIKLFMTSTRSTAANAQGSF